VSLASRIPKRYRDAGLVRGDAALALIVIAAWAVEVFALDSSNGHSRVLTFAVGVVAFSSIALRRRNPMLATIWFVGVSIAEVSLDTFYFDTATLPFVVLIWLAYSDGRYLQGRPMVGAGIVLVVGFMTALAITGDFDVGDIPFGTLFVFAPLLVGRGLANRSRLQEELRLKAAEAAEQGRAEAERAVELERGRIAAELQAVVANGISAMVVQAETVPAMLAGVNGSSDRVGAGNALAVIEETGRDTLAEMRRLLGVLRHSGDGPLLAPQPSLERLGSLIDAARQRGLQADLTIEGERATLAGGVELSAYRTVETALQEAAEAGATSASVRLSYGEREVDVAVTDDRPAGAPTADAELDSLRSRLDIYGGRLVADRHDNGFSVRVRLPRELT
jgi:signal transduction histidine kinase